MKTYINAALKAAGTIPGSARGSALGTLGSAQCMESVRAAGRRAKAIRQQDRIAYESAPTDKAVTTSAMH